LRNPFIFNDKRGVVKATLCQIMRFLYQQVQIVVGIKATTGLRVHALLIFRLFFLTSCTLHQLKHLDQPLAPNDPEPNDHGR
jgi:hypothetical protein